MLEQFFKSQVATVSDPQCNRITDALATAGIRLLKPKCQSASIHLIRQIGDFEHKAKVCHRDICR